MLAIIRIPYLVSILAPLFNILQNIPHITKTVALKTVDHLTVENMILSFLCNFCWSLHGYFIYDITLMTAGIFTLATDVLVIILYFIYRKTKNIQ